MLHQTTILALLALMVNGYKIPDEHSINYRPIIGVIAQESDSNLKQYGDTYIPAAYFQYIEMGGARGVPILVQKDAEYYDKMFDSLNGILFPGGGVSLLISGYAKAAKIFFDKAVKAYDSDGDYFPIWGTCMGFQILTAMTTGKDLLTYFDAEDIALPLKFSSDFEKSHLFKDLPEDVYQYLSKRNVTENFHHYGLEPSMFDATPDLNKFYRVLSTNEDRSGKEFISTMEAIKYPIYGTQWHPEKPNFQWNTHYHINHGPDAIRVAQYFASFLVDEARKSNHRFSTEEEEIDSLIQNYQPVYFHDQTFESMYFFNYTTNPRVNLN
ncbi:hypothetical protein ACF0H5_000519 [Mactra antiquata]